MALFDSTHWRLERDELARFLRRDWPDADVRVDAEAADRGQEVRDVVWLHGTGLDEIEGYSHTNGKCIYLDGPLHSAARFVAWYRGLIPEDIDLIFTDDAYSFDASVPMGAGRGDVISLAH
jgi:hypothetical protein